MANMASTIGKQIPGFMALGLMGKSVGMAKQSFESFDFDKNKNKKSKKEKKPLKKQTFIKDSVKIMAGVPMIGATAGMVNLI